MPKSFLDYLTPVVNSDPNSGIEVAIQWEIVQVDENPFHLSIPGDRGVKHFCLHLISKYRYLDDDDSEWLPGSRGASHDWPIKFFYSGYTAPSAEVFSRHIYDECRAAFLAIERSEYCSVYFRHRSEIGQMDVWRYLKSLHKDYSQTTDFIRDYDYWHDRLYQTQKWIGYMAGELDFVGAEVAIGDAIYDFLDLFD